VVDTIGLYGGNIIGGAYYPGLERVCVAFNLADETLERRATHAVEIMTREHDPNETVRVWWRIADSDGKPSWISINPGEFRTDPPEQPCVIKDMPQGLPEISLRDLLAGAVGSCSALPPFTEHESEVLAAAKRLLERTDEHVPISFYETVRSASHMQDAGEYQLLINRLYQTYLAEFQCTVVDFSLVILLFQLQRALNVTIQEDWRDNPAGYLRTFLEHMLQNEQTRASTIETLIPICKMEFESGRRNIAHALDGKMSAMPRQLAMSFHRFLMVKSMLNSLEKFVPRERLPVNPVVAEEALVCTRTGIHVGADFSMEHPDSVALDLQARSGPRLGAIRRQIQRQTSEIEPTFTRFFGRILAAQALAHSVDQADVQDAILELQQLAKEASSKGDEFEWSWLDHVLMNAYRRVGDMEAVQRFALRISAKLAVRGALAG
jgi:hypothetical protein